MHRHSTNLFKLAARQKEKVLGAAGFPWSTVCASHKAQVPSVQHGGRVATVRRAVPKGDPALGPGLGTLQFRVFCRCVMVVTQVGTACCRAHLRPVSRSPGLAPLGDGAEPTTMLNVLPSVSEV